MPLAPILSKINPLNWGAESRASLKDGAVPGQMTQDLEDQWISSMLLGAASSAGIHVNGRVAMGVSTVFACVAVKANTMASLPLNLYERDSKGKGRNIAFGHPLHTLLHDAPNEEMTSSDWRTALQANLDLHQNAYIVITRNGFGDIVELSLATPDQIEPTRIGRSGLLKYRYKDQLLDLSQIVHLRGMTFNGLTAASLTSTARDSIGLAATLDKNAGYFFKNGSFPGGFLQTANTLSPEAIKRLESSFQQATGGKKTGSVKILEEGLEYKEGRSPNKESQFDESRDRQGKDIARIFGVPQHKVGIIGNQPRANVEQENISFVTDTIRPVCKRWEQALNHKLLTPEDRRRYVIKFDLNALLRGAFKDRIEAYAKGRQWGWWSVNDIRDMEGQEGIGEKGDIYLQPLNMGDAAQQPPEDPANAS